MTRFIFFNLTLTLGLVLFSGSISRAGLVIDNFGTTGDGITVNGDISGVTLDTEGATALAGGYSFVSQLFPPVHFEYDLGLDDAGSLRTIGSVSLPNPPAISLDIPVAVNSFFDDWTLDILFTNTSGTAATVYSGEIISFFNDELNTSSVSLADANKIRFEFSFQPSSFGASSSGTFGGAAGSFVANPEPTSMLMFGSILGGMMFRRRKR